jgi:hypothetical protein
MQNLEKNGYLSNIRAQIRASVFKTIDSQESSGNKVIIKSNLSLPLSSQKMLKFKNLLKIRKDLIA